MNFERKKQELMREARRTGGDIPRHVAVIMDGNGRWAKKRGLPRVAGHHEGIKSVRAVVEAAGDIGVDFLTLYTFSKENWRRPMQEVSALMKLLVNTLRKEIDDLMNKNVQLRVIGQLSDLPPMAREEMEYGIKKTQHNTGLKLNLALSYSSRQEILSATKEICEKVKNGTLRVEELTEEIFADHLHTHDTPDPDLLIRTSGESRISNFLLWQIAYSEIYVTKTLWPDFRKTEFVEAVRDFLTRERRFGKVSEQIIHNVTG